MLFIGLVITMPFTLTAVAVRIVELRNMNNKSKYAHIIEGAKSGYPYSGVDVGAITQLREDVKKLGCEHKDLHERFFLIIEDLRQGISKRDSYIKLQNTQLYEAVNAIDELTKEQQ